MNGWWLILGVAVSSTFYYMAVVGGMFKEPLLIQFRKYGEENRVYPVCRLLMVAGFCCFILAIMLPSLLASFSFLRQLFPTGIFVVLGIAAWAASIVINRQPVLREALPVWYFELLRNSSRIERRHIGFAWLRIPWQMRLRLNSDNQAFRVWTELVRLTVIYGAHDPNSPWDVWT